MENSIPFPQADDFGKIVNLINTCDDSNLSDNRYISAALGDVSDRQVLYYLSAAAYLGLIDNSRNGRKYTDYGKRIKEMPSFNQEIELMSIVLKQPVFSKVYVLEKKIGHQNIEDVAEIIKDFYPGFSDSICERRAQTVIKWIEWVNARIEE